MWRWMVRVVGALAALVAAFAIGGAVSAMSRLPDLQPWHHLVTSLEPAPPTSAKPSPWTSTCGAKTPFFAEARQQVDAVVAASADPLVPNRYVAASRSAPSRFGTDFNRTQVVVPTEVRGGALLLHGLTDSPYSMRAMAERLQAAGYYTLSLRMQGHGTVPGGLVGVAWEDWAAAVRMGMRHSAARWARATRSSIVGYSNGGALAVNYALEALEDARLPTPAKLVLVSPMIGVSPVARVARPISLLGPLPFFEKARWLDVLPEYNPFKYNSFPANAGLQTGRFTAAIQSRLEPRGRGRPADPVSAGAGLSVGGRHHGEHGGSGEPPLQPAAGWWPRTGALRSQSDVGRGRVHQAGRRAAPPHRRRPAALQATLVTNQGAETLDVSAKTVTAGSTTLVTSPWASAGRPTCSRSRTLRCPFPRTTLCTAGPAPRATPAAYRWAA